MIDENTLRRGCEALGIILTDEQVRQFLTYYEFLVEKNQVMNLTAITEYEEVVQKHFVDSLSIVKVCDMKQVQTLLDSLNKRVQFLNELTGRLGCQEITAVHGRAEDFGKNPAYREQFDLCVSRAVANLSSLSEYCVPFINEKGRFISYKSMEIDTEVQEAKKAIYLLGGKVEQVETFCLPGSDLGRSFVVIRKERPTPAKYPRKAGLPSKEPLGSGGKK